MLLTRWSGLVVSALALSAGMLTASGAPRSGRPTSATTPQPRARHMSDHSSPLRIDYIEFPATDLAAVKRFYATAFGWTFTDYGPKYTSFADGRIAGGFTTDQPVRAGGPLVVLRADDLEAALAKVEAAGGRITKRPFTFPGGRRFHFTDPSGNELAVWSEH